MRAKVINEIQKFERGQDPKAAMEIGQVRDKKKLIALLSDPKTYPSPEEDKLKYNYLIQVIMNPSTQVRFEKKHESQPGDSRIVITLPSSPVNVFFFEVLSKSVGVDHDSESYQWDNPTDNTLNIWINS